MEIKVLGSGCAKCKKLLETTNKAVEELGVDAEILYVTEIEDIMKEGIMSTPGFMIDGVVKSTGRVLQLKEIKQFISDVI